MRTDSLTNLVARVIEASRREATEKHALVTSYDPKNYLAKCKLQPYGQLTGWMPIHSPHIGQGYGIFCGLQTGTGDASAGAMGGGGGGGGGSGSQASQASPQSLGDQVIVSFQGDHIDCGKIVQRCPSTQDKPPKSIESGEIMMWTKFKKDEDSGPDAAQQGTGGTGCKVYHKNDGSMTLEDGNGCSYVVDGNGNYTLTSGNKNKKTTILHQIVKDNPGIQSDDVQNPPQPQQVIHYHWQKSDKGIKTAVFNEQHYTTWDQNGVTHSSNNQVTSQAPNIPHIGNSSVSQNLTVGQTGTFGQGVTASGYATTSDVRLKVNVNPLPPALDGVMRLTVKTFDKRAVYYETGHGSRMTEAADPSLGLVAQEVKEVFPLVVSGNEKHDYLSIKESQVGMILLAAFQEFVRETRAEIADLKAQLDARPQS